MRNAAMNDMMMFIKDMTAEDKQSLVEQILGMMNESEPALETCNDLVSMHTSERPDCPHCGAKAEKGSIVRRGHNRNGAQRFRCKECGRFFVSSTNTALARTHKDADTWRKFIDMTIQGESIASCAFECDIAYQTAFNWRHKILNVFHAAQQETVMEGVIEADEMLFKTSYKGNRIKGKFGRRVLEQGVDNGLPRDAFKRGTDNKSTSPKDKVCVFCMVENGDKQFFAAVPGVGFMSETMLQATLPQHVKKEKSMMLVDQYKITRNYLDNNNYKNLILASNTSDNPHDHKPEIQGENRELHLQHVNSMHHCIRNFLKPYCGVSSKYLSNYISMFVWLKNHALQKKRKTAYVEAEKHISRIPGYITAREIHERPMLPQCA